MIQRYVLVLVVFHSVKSIWVCSGDNSAHDDSSVVTFRIWHYDITMDLIPAAGACLSRRGLLMSGGCPPKQSTLRLSGFNLETGDPDLLW